MIVAILNYGMGNLASVARAVESVGYTAAIVEHPSDLHRAARLVLPGVGAFAEGMSRLEHGGWAYEVRGLVQDKQVPLLGICLGMQFLADRGEEGGQTAGLGLVPGVVRSLVDLGCAERIPHVGWNEVQAQREDPVLNGIADGGDFYFVHSYGFEATNPSTVVATVSYGCQVAAVVRQGSVIGAQFHPEKSSRAGLQLLRNFIETG